MIIIPQIRQMASIMARTAEAAGKLADVEQKLGAKRKALIDEARSLLNSEDSNEPRLDDILTELENL